jgi:hypothetical protein
MQTRWLKSQSPRFPFGPTLVLPTLALPTLALVVALVICESSFSAPTPIGKTRKHTQCAGKTECSIIKALNEPSPLEPEDAFYREFVAGGDARVEREYQDRWAYQEKEMPYAGIRNGNEHVTLGTTETFGHGPYEGDVRRQFADRVLRIRTDAAIRAYFAPKDRAGGLKSAKQAIDKVKSVPMKLGGGENPGQIYMGYDLFTDASKLEYVKGSLRTGFYHAHLFSALTGRQNNKLDSLSWQVSASVGQGLPSTNLIYALNGSAIEGSIGQQLSRTVTASIYSRHPVQDQTIPHSYQFTIGYSF